MRRMGAQLAVNYGQWYPVYVALVYSGYAHARSSDEEEESERPFAGSCGYYRSGSRAVVSLHFIQYLTPSRTM